MHVQDRKTQMHTVDWKSEGDGPTESQGWVVITSHFRPAVKMPWAQGSELKACEPTL